MAVIWKIANHVLMVLEEKSGSNSEGIVFVHFDLRTPQRTGLLVLSFVSLNSELSKWKSGYMKGNP